MCAVLFSCIQTIDKLPAVVSGNRVKSGLRFESVQRKFENHWHTASAARTPAAQETQQGERISNFIACIHTHTEAQPFIIIFRASKLNAIVWKKTGTAKKMFSAHTPTTLIEALKFQKKKENNQMQ